jgi:hypothetical protein
VNVGYPRWWEPAKTQRNKKSRNEKLTGDFLDHFGHPLTVLAVKNGPPAPPADVLGSVVAKTSGLGVVRFNKPARTVTIECWPVFADVTKPGTQMDTWPVTVAQRDNYARAAAAWLPTLRVKGVADPVVQVFEEKSGELVYALRIRGDSFRPHVFAEGNYTVKVGDPDAGRMRTFANLAATANTAGTVEITL